MKKSTLKVEYAYSGDDATGAIMSLIDIRRNAFVETSDFPPRSSADGYDGNRAWERDPSGVASDQAGGDVIPIAITKAYRNGNQWWRPNYGGAKIVADSPTTQDGRTYDLLTVLPRGGVPFQAWFDRKTHLLARVLEGQGSQKTVTINSEYVRVDDVMIVSKFMVGDGTPGNSSTFVLTSVKFSAALPLAKFSRPKDSLADYVIAGAAHKTVVPFRLINSHIFVDVNVNGSKPLTFMFDTGGHTLLTPEAATALHVRPLGTAESSGGGEGVVTGGLATLKSIRLGDATLTNQPVSIVTFSRPEVEGVEQSGMIGYEFVARFVTRIDYGKRTLTLIDKRYFKPDHEGTMVPLRFFHMFPEVSGTYSGVPGRFGIDTGLGIGLILTAHYAAGNDLHLASKSTETMVAWGVGGPSRGVLTKSGDLALGKVRISHPLAVVSADKRGAAAAEASPNIVGGGVLKRFIVTLDYQNSKMYLKPLATSVGDLDTFNRSGMWINKAPDGFKVIDVTRGGPAEAAGIQKDDAIVAVDGNAAAGIDLPSMRLRLRNDAVGTIVRFTIRRGQTVKDVDVELRELF